MGTLLRSGVMGNLGKPIDRVFEPIVEAVDEHKDAVIRALPDRGAKPTFRFLPGEIFALQDGEICSRIGGKFFGQATSPPCGHCREGSTL